MAIYFSSLEIERPSHLGGSSWSLKDLNEVTVLFGKNGSGKSILLRSLRDKDVANQKICHYVSPERFGEITYDYNIAKDEINSTQRANSRKTNYSQNYHQQVVGRIQILLNKILESGREKKQGLIDIDFNEASLTEIENFMNTLMPDFTFKIVSGDPPYVLKRIESEQKVTSVGQLSSGESQIFALGLDILTISSMWALENQEKRILLIDEPDPHLHPDLQRHFTNFLTDILEKYKVQIIIATHSTTLLSALGFYGGSKTSVNYLNNKETEQKTIKFNKKLQEMSMCLGGHALMGPLFNSPILLVEGDDDYKIWSQVPRHHQINLAVISCNGAPEMKGYQKALEDIFESLRDNSPHPTGFALRDGDFAIPDENTVQQKHIKYLKLSCRESENLYLTDEVLSDLSINWETAKAKIKEKSNHYGEKAAKLNDCDNWDRKNTDIKEVINELALILDEKNLPWTLRVGKCIGKNKPTGKLSDFLGEKIITTLWHN